MELIGYTEMKSYDRKINQLIKLYTQAEKKLIKIICEKSIKGQVSDFYRTILKEVKVELMKLQLQSIKLSDDIVNELYLEAYKQSLEGLMIANIGDGYSKLHIEAINLLSENLINNFAEVNNQVGRRIDDAIRELGLTNTQMKFAAGQTIKELQKELQETLVKEGIGGITDKRGRVIPFVVYAKLLSRSIVAETQNTSVINVMKEHKRDLIKMTEHKTACKVCVEYEGKIYSISGMDSRYPALKSIPGFNKGYNNIHPNCRHRIRPYIEKYDDNYWDREKARKESERLHKPTDTKKELKFDTAKKASEYLKKEYGFEKVSFGTKVEMGVVNSLVNNAKKVYDKYPQLKGLVRKFEVGKMPKAYAHFKYGYNENGNILNLKTSSDLMDTVEKCKKHYDRDVEKGFHPKNTTWEDVIIHEYGHAIEFYLSAKSLGIKNIRYDTISNSEMKKIFNVNSNNKISYEIREKALKNLGIHEMADKSQSIRELSKYALQNSAECLAEAFADAMKNGDNANNLSKEILKLINMEMKKS